MCVSVGVWVCGCVYAYKVVKMLSLFFKFDSHNNRHY